MSDMLITMCVIAYNEEQNINGILECIKNQDYDHNNMEVVLVDGASTDNTRALMCEFALDNKGEFRRVVVLDNPKKTLPSGWNVALREYKGDAIIKVDAHAAIPEDFVSKNVRVLETGEYICGGHYRSKSRMGGTRPGELVGEFKVGYTSYYDRIRSECC